MPVLRRSLRPLSDLAHSVTHHPHSRYLPGSISIASDFIVTHGKGSYVFTEDERRILDFSCGIGVVNLGHAHPRIVAAATKQIQKGAHLQYNCYSQQPMIELARKLVEEVLPPQLNQLMFANSGAESIENAVKLARHATKRQNVVTFQGSFHGRTLLTGAMTNSKTVYRAGFGPQPSGIFVAPFPYCERCSIAQVSNGKYGSRQQCCMDPMRQLELMMKQCTAPTDTAAIVIEPVLGEGGYVQAPKEFIKALRAFASQHGIMLIFDEVQTGYGRTGTFFSFEQYNGVVPDILVMAKGIANGFPLSAIAASRELFSRQAMGSIGGTFGGNAVSCAAGIATIDVIHQENILSNVNTRSNQLRSRLAALQHAYPIRDVRGLGLMIGLELDDKFGSGIASKLQKAMLKKGLLTLTTGIYETLRLIPPLNVSEGECDIALVAIEESLSDVFRGLR